MVTNKVTTQPNIREEVPPGYRKTEVGMIPKDWEVKALKDIGHFFKGRGIKRDDVSEDGSKCIRYGEIYTEYENYVVQPISHIPARVALHALPIRKGDLLFAGSGETADEIGKCVAYLGNDECYAGGDIVVLRPLGQDYLFLGYLMNHSNISQQKAKLGQGDAVVHISSGNLARLIFPRPSLPEQQAIAATLSDADGLLKALNKLISKKRAITLATMQQLLAGKTRLPGFSGEWKTKKLGEIADILKGSGLSKGKLDPSGNNKCILYGELFTTYKQVIEHVVSRTNAIEGRLSKYGDILMPGSTTTVGIDLATASALLEGNVLLGGDIIILRKKGDGYNSEFLAHYLTQIKKYAISELAQGITIIHLYGSNLTNLELRIPATIKEQDAIAAVISDMDIEIAALERRLEKTKAIKQGMMQVLLNGQVRLVIQEANV